MVRQVDVEKLDYHHYLPIFFDGCRTEKGTQTEVTTEGCANIVVTGVVFRRVGTVLVNLCLCLI